jgi:molybdopterin-guanine dinucleotide biosynthesis protein A
VRLDEGAWGVVFCGGASRRMGRDKGALVLEGATLVERAAHVLAGVVPRVLLAAGTEPRYPELGLECVLDRAPGVGPLAGLEAALARLEAEGLARACILACDMPDVTPAVLDALLSASRDAEVDVVLVGDDGREEPLCAVYHVRVLGAVRAALARGERRLNAFYPDVRVRRVPEAELGFGCAGNLNTPEEFRARGGDWS